MEMEMRGWVGGKVEPTNLEPMEEILKKKFSKWSVYTIFWYLISFVD